MEWVCRHLGHDKDVHLAHYRNTSSIIERTQIGKILLMQDLNIQHKFRGKKLEDIQFTDILKDQALEQDQALDTAASSSMDRQHTAQNVDSPGEVSSMNGDEDSEIEEFQQKKKKKKPYTGRQRWTAEEVKELEEYLSENFKSKVTPGKTECFKAIKQSRAAGGQLQYRDRLLIVKKVSAMLQKEKRK